MIIETERLVFVKEKIDSIISRVKEMEMLYADELSKVHPVYHKSALNLIHYLAFRSFDIDELQEDLRDLGLTSLSNIEAHVMRSLLSMSWVLNRLLGQPAPDEIKGIISFKKSEKILNRNTKLMFGYKSKRRRTRIMVTLPGSAAGDPAFINRLMKNGMNSARINCAHDDRETWFNMISHIREISEKKLKKCKVMMDLGGPKLRTGAIKHGPKIVHIKPEKDVAGKVVNPAKVWIAPPEFLPPENNIIHIPINEQWFREIKRGDIIRLKDTRNKKVDITVAGRSGNGRLAFCFTSAYISTGTELQLYGPDKSEKAIDKVGELLPIEQYILLKENDTLILHSDPREGEPAAFDESGNLLEVAHVSCTLPEIFKDVKVGELIFFDDGKIEGLIEEVSEDELKVRITYAKDVGSKLKADKGINLPHSNLKVSGLTQKDREDLEFVAENADTVNFSFVNDENDVQELLDELEKYENTIGIILKIETQKGFKNLPRILLQAMQTFPIGVMIARGDLAIETGWKNFATIQEEILRICEAAHIPDVWATQVLESLAKKGVPSRAEITDAALAQRAECVMLNKGVYIEKAVKMLDRILCRMQHFQKKKETMLPRLEDAENLHLSHDKFNI